MDDHQSATGYQRLPDHPVEQPQYSLGRFPRPINQHFAHIRSFYVGVGLMIIGLASIHLNILDLVVSNSPTMLRCSDKMRGGGLEFESLGVVGHGIWTGIMCVIGGGFAVGAGHKRTNCQIRASIVLNIFAAIFCVAQFSVALSGAIVIGQELCWCSNDGSCRFKMCDVDAYTLCQLVRTLVAAESLLTILGAVGFVTSIYLAGLGCRSACCCNCRSCCCDCCADCCGDCCLPYQPIPQHLMYSDVPVAVTQQHPIMPTGIPQPGQHPAYYGLPTGQEYSTVARPPPAYQQQSNFAPTN